MVLRTELIYHYVVDIYARCFSSCWYIYLLIYYKPYIHNHITLLFVEHTSSTVSCPASCRAFMSDFSLELQIKHCLLSHTSSALSFIWTRDSRRNSQPFFVWTLSWPVLSGTTVTPVTTPRIFLHSHSPFLIPDLLTSPSPTAVYTTNVRIYIPSERFQWLPFYPMSSSPLIRTLFLSPQIILPIWSLDHSTSIVTVFL
jgi:hypothetical protein